MKKYLLYLFIFISFYGVSQNQEEQYGIALTKLACMLDGSCELNFKQAVFLVENTYLNNTLDSVAFNQEILKLKLLAIQLVQSRNLKYDGKDKNEVEKYAALFSVIKDTISIVDADGKKFQYVPYSYDFKDVWGHKEWTNMFVSKLLQTGKGNCHSLPYLYKILAEELETDAHLALAPNHMYIKHKNDKNGWYNTELTSGIFPIDAWLMASGYIHLDAITNKLYMEALDDKQSIAMCVLDLAQGFNKAFPENDGRFVYLCTELALKYYPHYINALIMRAETKKKITEDFAQKKYSGLTQEALNDKQILRMYMSMQEDYVSIHKLGYRMMPEEMYLDWLTSLEKERRKYENQNITSKL